VAGGIIDGGIYRFYEELCLERMRIRNLQELGPSIPPMGLWRPHFLCRLPPKVQLKH